MRNDALRRAQDGDEHELARGGPVCSLRIDVPYRQRAAKPRQGAGDQVVDVHNAIGRRTEIGHTQLVVD